MPAPSSTGMGDSFDEGAYRARIFEGTAESWSELAPDDPAADPRDSQMGDDREAGEPLALAEPFQIGQLEPESIPRPSLGAPRRSARPKFVIELSQFLPPVAAGFAVAAVIAPLISSDAHRWRLMLAAVATVLGLFRLWPLGDSALSKTRARLEHALARPLVGAHLASSCTIVHATVVYLIRQPGYATAIAVAAWTILGASIAEWFALLSSRRLLLDARTAIETLSPPSGDMEDEIGAVAQVVSLTEGQRLVWDVVVTQGVVGCSSWGQHTVIRRGPGDPIPAGARIREGSATARISAVGRERAFARLLVDALGRRHHGSPALEALDRWTPWVVVLVMTSALVLGLLSRGRFGPSLLAALAAGTAVMVPPARRLAVRDQLLGIVTLCRRGAAFRGVEAFTRASQVRTVVFCARGTVESARLEVCEVELLTSGVTPQEILALAAGAERGLTHPIAVAVLRAVEARGLRPTQLRAARLMPGLGVLAELSSTVTVVVGSRALCMRSHVPTAEHEARITELESKGHDVVLVARGGKVLGALVLHAPLRAGAVAAIQRLHDIDVEPALIGGAARARLEAIGRAIDVTHVRPEVPPADRPMEIRRIAQSGGTVAVVGRPSSDADVLDAADVSMALDAAGLPAHGEPLRVVPALALSHDHLPGAVDALALAQATRARVASTLAVGLTPVAAAALPVAFGLIRPSYASLAALAATVALAVRDVVAAALPEGGRNEEH